MAILAEGDRRCQFAISSCSAAISADIVQPLASVLGTSEMLRNDLRNLGRGCNSRRLHLVFHKSLSCRGFCLGETRNARPRTAPLSASSFRFGGRPRLVGQAPAGVARLGRDHHRSARNHHGHDLGAIRPQRVLVPKARSEPGREHDILIFSLLARKLDTAKPA